jgi:dipeptidyl aminopeptidase/acylaminoacyl peptidase
MRKAWNNIAAAMATALGCILVSPACRADPMTIDDLLRMESFGAVSIDPTGALAVYERRRPFDTADRYDYGHRSVWALTDLYRVDLETGGPPARLLPTEAGEGITLGPWSPSGERLAVYRLAGDRLEIGVLEIARGEVFWTGLTPDFPIEGVSVEWLDNDRLAAITRPDDSLPWILRHDGASQTETTRRWRRMADGRTPSSTVIETRSGVPSTTAPASEQAVIVIDAAREETLTLVKGQVRDVAASPDGRRLAVRLAERTSGIAPNAPLRQSAVADAGRLVLVDSRTGATVARTRGLDVAPHLLRWSPDAAKVLIYATSVDGAWDAGSLHVLGADGAVSKLNHAGLDPFRDGQGLDQLRGVTADWMGGVPILYARTAPEARFDWFSVSSNAEPCPLTAGLSAPPDRLAAVTDDSVLLFGDGAVWAASESGALRRLSDPALAISDTTTHDIMEPLRQRVNSPPRRTWVVGADRAGTAIRVDRNGVVEAFAGRLADETTVVSTTGPILVTLSRNRGIETLAAASPTAIRRIDQVNAGFGARAFGRVRALPHADRQGAPTTSYLFLPESRSAPLKGLVVMIYPGSVEDGKHHEPRTLLYGLTPELVAEAGYAVLSASIPLAGDGARTPLGFSDSVDAAVAAARAAEPAIPAGRTAIVGHSFGGYTALWIAALSDRYQSYVSWAGASDLFGIWGEFMPVSRSLPQEGFTLSQQMGWAEIGQGGAGGPPWSNVETYAEGSPYMAADAIAVPVLLITSDRDFVPMSQAERMFTALHRQGKRARLITYWGEGHSNWSPANIRDLYAQLFDWLDLTLNEDAATSPAGAGRTDGPPRHAPIPPAPLR